MTERRDFSLQAETDLANHRLVKFATGLAAYNTAAPDDTPIGVTKQNVKAGDDIGITPMNKEGSVEIEAAGPIRQGERVYAADDGRIRTLPAAAGTYRKIGLALAPASAAGSIIEVMPYGYTATDTIT